MPNAKNEPSAPISDGLDLEQFVRELVQDYHLLRNGKLSVAEARARAALAHQVLSGVRAFLIIRRSIEEDAKQIGSHDEGDK